MADTSAGRLRFRVGQAKAGYPREEEDWCSPGKHRIWEEEGFIQSQ